MNKTLILIAINLLMISCSMSTQPQDFNTAEVNEANQSTQKVKLIPQKTCPYLGSPIDPNKYVVYQGKRLYVCCDPCLDKAAVEPEKAILILKEQFGETLQDATH